MSDQVPPSSHRLRQMASDYEEAITEARSEQIAARAVVRARADQPTGRRFLALALGVSMALLVVVALGVTTASSLPGDPLYGISRAYEEVGDWVGVVDPVEQRLNEVIALADLGETVLAAQAAEEALVALGYAPDFELALTPTTTTTTPGQSDQTSSDGTTPTTAPPAVTVQASPEETAEERNSTLRLAAELLLNSVKGNGSELEAAAAGLADVVSDIAVEEEPVIESAPTTTISPTSTTLPEDTASTTTTIPGSTTTTVPDSTTTTVPEDGEDGEGSDDQGPIFIPPGF